MNIQKTILASAIMALGLAGCGTEEQDSSIDGRSANSENNAAPGIVVDGPVVRATVFYDLNGNFRKDSYEPSATTDNDGFYNKNNLKGLDYCSGAAARPEFCLRLSDSQAGQINDSTKIIVTGGYDLYTGEPFEGSMAIKAKNSVLSSLSNNGEVAVTPLSTIASYVSEQPNSITLEGEVDFTNGFGININLLEPTDPEGDGFEDNFQKAAFVTTYQAHKYVSIIADWTNDFYSEIGEDENLPTDLSSLIYPHFSNLNDGNYEQAVSAILLSITELYNNADVDLPTTLPNAADIGQLVIKLNAVRSAIVTAFGDEGSKLTYADRKARVRGVEVVISKIIRGLDYSDALNALGDEDYITNLAGDGNGNINFTQLVEFSGANFVDASNTAKDTAGSQLSEDLAGKSLEFSSNTNTLTSSAAIFFTGDEGATQGKIHLCLEYLDDNKPNDRLDGDYISGNWETLPALNNTVMLGLNYVGYRTAVLKKIGDTVDGTDYRFEFAGEITTFNSDDSFENTAENVVIPTSNETCKTHLDNIAAQEQALL